MTNPAEAIYRALYERRKAKFSRHVVNVGVPVISIGNITLGGTGKTPCVQFVARELQKSGRRVAIVSRGYGGALSQQGAVVSDGEKIFFKASKAGDEPLLHARSLPDAAVVIGVDRVRAARRAIDECGVQIIVLDDGFQFYSLHRDSDIVLLDARRPFDNGHLLPLGRLREPAQSLKRASALVLTRCNLATADELQTTHEKIKAFSSAPVFQANHAPQSVRDENSGAVLPLEALKNKRVAAISALAHNQQFQETLKQNGAQIVAQLARRDHHFWREKEVRDFVHQAHGAEVLMTTEKDAVKMRVPWSAPLPLWSLVIALNLGDDEMAFRDFLKQTTDEHR